MKASKILSRETVFKSKYFHVEKKVVEQNGKTFTKDFVIRKPHVMILPLTENKEIFLVKQYREALGNFSLEAVAGFAEDGTDDPLETAKRELHEETGITAKDWKKLMIFNIAGNITSYGHLFLARNLQVGPQHLDEDEDIAVVKLSLKEAVKKVINCEIVNAPSVAALLLLDKLIQEGEVHV